MIVVSGLGRNLSSGLMRALKAGGIKMTGGAGPPLWEDPRVIAFTEADRKWLDVDDSWAIKILNPHICTPPVGIDFSWIWIDRDRKAQFKSQVKASLWMSRFREKFSILTWRRRAIKTIGRIGGRLLMLHFEEITDPDPEACRQKALATMTKIAAHVRHPFDINAAASVIRPRAHCCLPDMSAEGKFKKGFFG